MAPRSFVFQMTRQNRAPGPHRHGAQGVRQAFDGLEGVSYTPYALLASRTTASGRQYRILCKATVVYPGAEMHYAVVDVYESLEGNANIISVTDGYVS